jgi:hypothetical protein
MEGSIPPMSKLFGILRAATLAQNDKASVIQTLNKLATQLHTDWYILRFRLLYHA